MGEAGFSAAVDQFDGLARTCREERRLVGVGGLGSRDIVRLVPLAEAHVIAESKVLRIPARIGHGLAHPGDLPGQVAQ